jgi:excisionase family DNA binding protein
METRLLLTPSEAAHWLGICRSKVYELLYAGELRSVKIGRSRRIPTSAVIAYVDSLEDAA